jgi:hypothetical protein
MATAEDVLPLIRKAEGYPKSSTVSKPDPRGGHGGAIGIHQVTPDTAKAYGFDPRRLHEDNYNTTVAKFIVSDLHSRFGADDTKATLIGYNAGPGTVKRWQDAGRDDTALPAQTQEYIQRAGLPLSQPQQPQKSVFQQRIDAALKEGYTMNEINSFVAQKHQEAKSEGYTDADIQRFMAGQ